MSNISRIILLFNALLLCACSNQAVYDAIQARQKVECQKLPQSSEYEECMKQQSEDYEDYQKKREKLEESQ